MNIKKALTIAGSDPSGGAGIQADIKAFSANGVYGMAVITALTAQNTLGVFSTHTPPIHFLIDQIDRVFEDIRPDAVKIGMVANAEIINAIVQRLKFYRVERLVIDPVMISSTGSVLLDKTAIEALKFELLPLATVVTPNLSECAALLNMQPPENREAMVDMALQLSKAISASVLLKGGHLNAEQSPDLLYYNNKTYWFENKRINTKNTHGTGCTLSSALAANLAKSPNDIVNAVARAKSYVTTAIAAADKLNIGTGIGPTHHFENIWPL